ncbi:FAD-dependent oxidoreductase [Nocardia sp. NBC_00511]|uniref:FAD-dependent oxidoreductase n=1 Tax=Nocardia sp. NBC_00511 TaxID=2903591 RepID=UPI0030E472EB
MSGLGKVLISGGGLGGLALAQALRRGGIEVAVHEQDPSPRTRNQGYRIHIDGNGNAALRACLPTEVLDTILRTSGINGDLVAGYTSDLRQTMAQTFDGLGDDEITHVDRETFRRGLLTGLDDAVHFGHTLTDYRITESGRVRIEFAEGGGDEGDLLIGADGVGSPVRRRLLPQAEVRDLGLRCLYGRMPLTAQTTTLLPADFDRGFIWVAGESGSGVGFAPQRFRDRPVGAVDYLMVAYAATTEQLGVPDDRLYRLDPADLWQVVTAATADWHPKLRALIAHADPDSFFPITIRAGQRLEPWRSGPITLLGDAIHTMPPTGGVGANTALQDAATLAAELLSAARGEKSVLAAVADYERVMVPRGFDTVDSSLRMAGQLFG